MSLIELKKPNKTSLLPEFEAFILNDGYSSRIIKGSVCIAQYKHPSKPMLQFENTGKMKAKEFIQRFLEKFWWRNHRPKTDKAVLFRKLADLLDQNQNTSVQVSEGSQTKVMMFDGASITQLSDVAFVVIGEDIFETDPSFYDDVFKITCSQCEGIAKV